MSITHPAKVAETKKAAHRQALVNEPVVDHEVGESEQRHPDTDAENDLTKRARVCAAAVKNKRDRNGRMKDRKRVVRFHPAATLLMMRSVHRPQNAVPHFPVQEAGPQLHAEGDQKRNRYPHESAHRGSP